jgi:hypothetical protein
LVLLAGLTVCNTGCGVLWCCKQAEVTAVSLNPCDPMAYGHGGKPAELGIPFYLPKPLLIVAKNFRNIEEAKVGLTGSAPIPNYLDDQAKYGDVNARTSWTPVHMTPSGQPPADTSGAQQFPTGTSGSLATASDPKVFAGGAPVSPGAVPSDGLTPDTFFTYQIVFVPDLTQKYALKLKGGAGELRAAMNMVNGWMFTGLGPFYMKDSSTAQNVLASGIASNLTLGGAADVINSVQNLRAAAAGRGAGTGTEGVTVTQIREVHEKIVDKGFTKDSIVTLSQYAEIHVFEPYLTPEGQMEWRPVTELCFNRDFLGAVRPKVTRDSTIRGGPPIPEVKDDPQAKGAGTGTPAVAPAPSGPTQVNVNCGTPCADPSVKACVPAVHKGPVLRLWDACRARKQATVATNVTEAVLTPQQLEGLINARSAGAPALLPAPTPGAPRIPPAFTPGTLPPGLTVFGGPRP